MYRAPASDVSSVILCGKLPLKRLGVALAPYVLCRWLSTETRLHVKQLTCSNSDSRFFHGFLVAEFCAVFQLLQLAVNVSELMTLHFAPQHNFPGGEGRCHRGFVDCPRPIKSVLPRFYPTCPHVVVANQALHENTQRAWGRGYQ